MFSFIRLAVLALFFYLATKILAILFKPQKPPRKVDGQPQSKPLDVSDNEIEDVDFKELDD
ncbi:hypothetical protein JW992_09490 [candidate division KSB1 bacterium]|nr:hypothetical protein [candidate division KSB1 bacterium]